VSRQPLKDPRIPIDDHLPFRGGPFHGQKFRVPFGKARTMESAIQVGNTTIYYRPVPRGTPTHYEFVSTGDTPESIKPRVVPR
jgi:hypothetical protein